ncbi:ATP synthase F0 subunit B [Oscillospiraceae bacterium MB08-C2-2]|nr:ATP synthase F0 subunit B [Oscillospiraceae bacterium MB08-C2-2]
MSHYLTQSFLLAAGAAQELPPGTILHLDKKLLIELGIQWVNVLFLTGLLIFILYKPVRKFMSERTARIKTEIEDARHDREEAMQLKEQYGEMIANIEREREEILRLAHKKAMEKSDQLLFEARREADAAYDRTMDELERQRKSMEDEMKKQMIEISMLVASRFVTVSLDTETQNRYIEEALSDWEAN